MPEGKGAMGADIGESMRTQQCWKFASILSINALLFHQVKHNVLSLPDAFKPIDRRIWRERERIKLFEDDPSPRFEGSYNLGKGVCTSRKMMEHEARMHEVECPFGQGISDDIVLTHFEMWLGEMCKETGVDIGSQYVASWSDTLS